MPNNNHIACLGRISGSLLAMCDHGGLYILQEKTNLSVDEEQTPPKKHHRPEMSNFQDQKNSTQELALLQMCFGDLNSASCCGHWLASSGTWFGLAGPPLGAPQHCVLVGQELCKTVQEFSLGGGSSSPSSSIWHTSQYPVCLQSTMGGALDHSFLVGEGSSVTLWDRRLRLPVCRTTCSGADVISAIHPVELCCAPSNNSDSQQKLESFPFTEHAVVTASSDRAVTLWDLRKWTKVGVAQSTLKFSPSSLAFASATGAKDRRRISNQTSSKDFYKIPSAAVFIVAGIDTEANIVVMGKDAKVQIGECTTVNQQPENQASDTKISTTGKFRQRLCAAQHCQAGWHGQWVYSKELSGALGLSTTGEIFLGK